ncbi:MAG TPA: tRNA (N6-isopentenyl adenosine(37)-C2)-methylthiotransferase MiaB [Desulfobacteraceae bacterium]|nr:tRNA (N6-isopentenyl adenosine(37)-C2)-methylthiotransferase MiaB [Desulfobacteraceae bacterium]
MFDRTFHIHTIGCQMNVYDADLMANALMAMGYRPVADPEAADLAIVNTCAIREKAEQKVYSLLGRLAGIKRRRPEMRLAVGGCVAQLAGRRIQRRAPYVDLVFGTRAIERLPGLVRRLEAGEGPLSDVGDGDGVMEIDGPRHAVLQPTVSRFVTIMQGCDNFCTYCVVPYARGREMSRDPGRIVAEVEVLVAAGAREVTLLGQNVNSYGNKEGLCSFAELLTRVAAVEGLARIRFTTSHPKDLSPALIDAFARLDKLCDHIHLPVQSGSDRILARMNRRYGRQTYLDLVARLRAVRPQIAITSDIIVGFPGETEEDFNQTLDLVQAVGFDGLFAFHYSDRPGTPASRLTPKVPMAVKRRRLDALNELQNAAALARHQALVGRTVEVLVEGASKRSDPGRPGDDDRVQWTGRTSSNKVVNFSLPSSADAPSPEAGQLHRVRIEAAFAHSLLGVWAPDPAGLKGEACHAA